MMIAVNSFGRPVVLQTNWQKKKERKKRKKKPQ